MNPALSHHSNFMMTATATCTWSDNTRDAYFLAIFIIHQSSSLFAQKWFQNLPSGSISVLDWDLQSSKYFRYGCSSRFFNRGGWQPQSRVLVPPILGGRPWSRSKVLKSLLKKYLKFIPTCGNWGEYLIIPIEQKMLNSDNRWNIFHESDICVMWYRRTCSPF